MIKIDPEFWSKVEDSSNLNYVVYGDSVSENEYVFVGFKFNNYKLKKIKFKELWNKLYKIIEPSYINGKEYLYINDEIKIESCINIDTTNPKYPKYLIDFVFPKYLIRHKINKNICKLEFDNNNPSLSVTFDHSLLQRDNDKLIPIKPNDATYILQLNDSEFRAKQLYIKNKKSVEYNGYVYDISVPITENFIVNGYIIHNTDSLYINVPSIKYKDAKDANDQVTKISSEINKVITNVLENKLLPKFGVDKKYNKTDFKIESVISIALFLDIKKNYAYKEIAKKGKIYDEPEVHYTGIPVIRSDYSKLSQDFIRELIENIAFDESPNSDKPKALIDLANKKHSEIKKCIETLDLKYIATPGKWNTNYKNEPFTVIGMRLYNTIMDSEIFRPGTDGMSVPIRFKDSNKFLEKIKKNKDRSDLFLNNINIDKINFLTVPSNFEPDVLNEKFNEFLIYIDITELWDKSYAKIAKDIVNVIKNEK